MVDATRVFEPGFQVTNAAGTPQSGAVLRFYANTPAGATRTVYSDLGLSTSLGVTVTTNSSGRPAASGGAGAEVVIYTGTTPYAVTAETSAGVSLWSFSNVIGALDTSLFLTNSITAETPVISKTADYTIVDGDQGKVINGNPTGGTFSLILPSAVTVGDGWRVTIRNVGTANQVNIATVSAQTVDGQSSLALTIYLEGLTLVSDGANWHIADTANPGIIARTYNATGGGFSIIGGNLIASVATSILTVAIKTSAGNDPSAAAPVKIVFRGQSAADEEFAVITITAATSIAVPDTATLGTANSTAFRLWFVGFNDAGTFRLGVINCLSGTNIYALGQFPIVSSTAIGTGSDSAHVFYTGSAVTSKPYSVLAYATWESGIGTAGTWSATPTRFQLFGPGVPLPGNTIQSQGNATGVVQTGTTVVPVDNTIPQNTEGDQYMTQAITPTSASNLLEIESQSCFASSANSQKFAMSLFQDSTASAIATAFTGQDNLGIAISSYIKHIILAAQTSETTLKIRIGANNAGTTYFNGSGGTQLYGGVANSFLRVREIMT